MNGKNELKDIHHSLERLLEHIQKTRVAHLASVLREKADEIAEKISECGGPPYNLEALWEDLHTEDIGELDEWYEKIEGWLAELDNDSGRLSELL